MPAEQEPDRAKRASTLGRTAVRTGLGTTPGDADSTQSGHFPSAGQAVENLTSRLRIAEGTSWQAVGEYSPSGNQRKHQEGKYLWFHETRPRMLPSRHPQNTPTLLSKQCPSLPRIRFISIWSNCLHSIFARRLVGSRQELRCWHCVGFRIKSLLPYLHSYRRQNHGKYVNQ